MTCPGSPLEAARWTLDFRLRAARERRPIAATLELTRRCNLRCVHCYLGDQAEQHRQQSRELGTAAVQGRDFRMGRGGVSVPDDHRRRAAGAG
jgi:hypothetical protein